MPKYTTGEIAKLCGVSVRTVQYYDSRQILMPSELTEGGRRIYNDNDLRTMRIICFLRDLNLPINSIKELLSEKHPEKVISVLLDEQEKLLISEMNERQQKVDRLVKVKKSLCQISSFSVESIADIAYIMERKKKLKKLRLTMIAIGLVMDAIEVATLMLWILKGIWIPFVIGIGVVIALGVFVSKLYYTSTVYICPECHTVFRPSFKELFFARHTPNTRKLTCHHCGYNGFCIETYGKGVQNNA